MREMKRRALGLRVLAPEVESVKRPKTRGDCVNGIRPCPFVSCKHHLYLDVSSKTGGIKVNFPDLQPDELEHSCSLDIADRGGETLEEVGAIMNIVRERVRQLETKAIAKIARKFKPLLGELADTTAGRVYLPMLAYEPNDFGDIVG
jgi:hypothetical protein